MADYTEQIEDHLNNLLNPLKSTAFEISEEESIQNIHQLQTVDPKDGWDMNILIFQVSKLRTKKDLQFVTVDSLGKIFQKKNPSQWNLMKDNDNMEYMVSRIAASQHPRHKKVFIVEHFYYDGWKELTGSENETFGVFRKDVDFALKVKTLYNDLELFTVQANQENTSAKKALNKLRGKLKTHENFKKNS